MLPIVAPRTPLLKSNEDRRWFVLGCGVHDPLLRLAPLLRLGARR